MDSNLWWIKNRRSAEIRFGLCRFHSTSFPLPGAVVHLIVNIFAGVHVKTGVKERTVTQGRVSVLLNYFTKMKFSARLPVDTDLKRESKN